MTDDELIEKMALAAWKSEGYTVAQWCAADYQERSTYLNPMRAALAVARPIIEREAYKKAEQLALTSKGYPTDVSQKIRALGEDNEHS